MVPGRVSARAQLAHEVFEAVAELGASFYDEALQMGDDEREAALFASATLISALEQEKLLLSPQRDV